MKPSNPFILSSYYSPEYFCNRYDETLKIINALKNGRNITLFSIRRMGKTGLIEHIFQKLKKDKQVSSIYIDILPTMNFGDFINAFAKSVLGKFESKPELFFKKIGELFINLRPIISYDQYTGLPNIQLNIQTNKEATQSLEQIFNYLKKSNKQIIIALDEFQQIIRYSEKNVEAILRANIQKANNINFIFSGSQKHLLISMFNEYGSPFYQSTEMMHLEKITPSSYIKFIKTKFRNAEKQIEDEQIRLILEITRNHTYYVQFLCNKLYGSNEKKITDKIILKTLLEILEEKEAVYINYRNLLTNYQWKLLKAIANEENVQMITSNKFINTYNLNTPSSVKTAVDALLTKEMIFRENNCYLIYDVFFGRWLARQ